MKNLPSFEEFINESFKNNSPTFYSSNHDKKIKPTEPGWYVGFKTKSGDTSFMKVDKEPKDNKEAMEMIKKINPDELYSFITNVAQVK